jgi:plasmid stabilization system protein ParE
MIRVIVSPKARSDLHAIVAFIAAKAGAACAARYAFRIDHCLELISDFPEAGAVRSELGLSIRIRPVAP